MKCHAGVEFESGQPCPRCKAKLGEVCWPGINSDLAELPKAREALRHANIVLSMLLPEIADRDMVKSVRETLDLIDAVTPQG